MWLSWSEEGMKSRVDYRNLNLEQVSRQNWHAIWTTLLRRNRHCQNVFIIVLHCFISFAQSCPTLLTPWIAGRQASLSISNSRSLPKLMSIKSLIPSSHLILCHPLLLLLSIFPSIGVFSNDQHFEWGDQNIGASASVSILPMSTQDWSPLGWTGWISLQFKGLSKESSPNTTVQKHQFFGIHPSLWSNSHVRTWPLEKP